MKEKIIELYQSYKLESFETKIILIHWNTKYSKKDIRQVITEYLKDGAIDSKMNYDTNW